MNASHVLLALGLPWLLLSSGCRCQTRTSECAWLAETVNARLDRVETSYRAGPQEKVQWTAIAQSYQSAVGDLKQHKIEDPRLSPLVAEYAVILDVAARHALSVAEGLKRGSQPDMKHALELLRQQSEQHSRLSARIDRVCRSQ